MFTLPRPTPPTILSALSLAALLAPGSAAAAPAGPNDMDADGRLEVTIFYDNTGPYAELGPIYAEMLMNLLGHFTEVVAWAEPVEGYTSGGLLTAEVAFYIGSTFNNPLPAAFIDDVFATTRPLVWMGYNLWQPGWQRWNDFVADYGFQHFGVEGNSGGGQETGFFRYVQYNGKELPKFAWWNADAGTFVNDPFVNRLSVLDASKITTKATIVHSTTGEAMPYILQAENLWHVTDIPFTYIHERDRYLAMTDLLHDMVGLSHPTTRRALMRLEDVHPNVPYTDVRTATNVMKEGRQRPWNFAMIPVYSDPLGYYNDGVPLTFNIGASRASQWRTQVNRARTYGAQIVMHGYTHQFGSVPNPYNGVSGDDFEFWDSVANAPVVGDSYSYVRTRLNAGRNLINGRGWSTWAWETPHYRASPLDYLAFNDFFPTTYQRVVYYPYTLTLWGNAYTFSQIWNNPSAITSWTNAVVGAPGDRWGGQFFPYVIEHDVYGQRIIPENLGNIEPPEFALGPQYVRVVPDLLAAADANLVNRCAFASFFYHPYLLQFPEIPNAGGAAGLRALVQGVEALGYTFVQASALGNNTISWTPPPGS
jgi:uncharacterized protein YdaL